jgi:anhydro-N-acetylmuramic acid kinase
MSDQASAPAICIGLISGTSVDGVDVAIASIAGHAAGADARLLAFETIPYPAPVRAELLALYDDQANAVARLCSLNVVGGECFAEAALAVAQRAGIDLATVEIIGSHGQTVWPQPAPDPDWPLFTPSTLQIGEASVIAARTDVPVIADFRVADMPVGGQGAPLTPYFDWAAMTDSTSGRAVHNIGGIGNVTWLPAGAGVDDVIAFDTGPGSILVDGLVTLLTNGEQVFDRDGAFAAGGTPVQGMADHLLEDPYIAQPPPKTTFLARTRETGSWAAAKVPCLKHFTSSRRVSWQSRIEFIMPACPRIGETHRTGAAARWLPHPEVPAAVRPD